MQRQTRKLNTPKPSKIVVGYIHADWCGHCTALKPVWAQMRKIIPQHMVVYEDINSNYQDARIAKINAKYGVNMVAPPGYPYIFKIVDGKIHEYSGERTAKQLADWFIGKEQPEKIHDASGSKSEFGAGMFRGGIKKKTQRRRHTVGNKRGNKRRSKKSLFSQLFGN